MTDGVPRGVRNRGGSGSGGVRNRGGSKFGGGLEFRPPRKKFSKLKKVNLPPYIDLVCVFIQRPLISLPLFFTKRGTLIDERDNFESGFCVQKWPKIAIFDDFLTPFFDFSRKTQCLLGPRKRPNLKKIDLSCVLWAEMSPKNF